MSTPPPGTPPTPQPPAYPQYPPPAQYPPQYPPQQPYYGAPAPPPKESNTVLIIVLVVVIIVVVLVALAWWVFTALLAPAQSFRVTVTDTSWTISGDTVDFASSNLACGAECPQSVFPGTPMTFTVTLHNTDPTSNHTVTLVSVSSPFHLSSVTPTLPYAVHASSSTTFQITIDAATVGGSYVLSGVIYTS